MLGSQRKRHTAALAAAATGQPASTAVTDTYSRLDHVAVWVTDRVGTVGFFLLIFAYTATWTTYNLLATEIPSLGWPALDPFPAFVAYLLISNVIQICLMPLIMVDQRLQGRYAEARAESDHALQQETRADLARILALMDALQTRMDTLETKP